MIPYYVSDMAGSSPDRLSLMEHKSEDVLINMGGIIENFICGYMAVNGRVPDKLVLSPEDTDEFLAYMYLSSQGKKKLIPHALQGIGLKIDGERTCLI